jgi:hypothetical protein
MAREIWPTGCTIDYKIKVRHSRLGEANDIHQKNAKQRKAPMYVEGNDP